ncbi:MAG: hypothetical protein IKF22_09775, partial [Lachnospiraceae bacterium]|nr:hypothetical protein [Lachnospiraceae bacterium]
GNTALPGKKLYRDILSLCHVESPHNGIYFNTLETLRESDNRNAGDFIALLSGTADAASDKTISIIHKDALYIKKCKFTLIVENKHIKAP